MFTDIDDTLTTEGAITPDALQALADLRDAGLPVIAVTGRPVGWSVPFALAWPLRAIVAENGAVALISGDIDQIGCQRCPGQRAQLSKIYQQDAATRTRNFAHLQRAALSRGKRRQTQVWSRQYMQQQRQQNKLLTCSARYSRR